MLRRAIEISPFSFPRDHGQHPDFRMEWWYLSGRLTSEDGSDWAYHFTIFRRALECWTDLALVGLAISSKSIRQRSFFQRALAGMLESQNSRRISVDGYVGHLSITNISEGNYVFFERGGTSLFTIAGARSDGLDVWVKDWRLHETSGVVNVCAEREDFAVDLELVPLKPPALHGDHGLCKKGPEPGHASYHYSLPSLLTTGTLKWSGENHHVQGRSLMDREYGTEMLPRSVRGWDWFGLILANNHEVMISVIRNADGTIAGTSSGTNAMPDGSWKGFTSERLHVEPTEFWTNPATGTQYPTSWIIAVHQMDLHLEIRAVVREHELVSATSTTVDYWEGPVRVFGTMYGEQVAGHGHVELVGYAQSVGGKF